MNVFYLGFLRRKGQPHLLYKPVQAGSKGVQEVSFYDALYGVKTYLGTPSDFPSLCRGEGTDSVLRSFTPMYYGLASIADRGGKTRILCNILVHTHSSMFVYTCLCDLVLVGNYCMSSNFGRTVGEEVIQHTLMAIVWLYFIP